MGIPLQGYRSKASQMRITDTLYIDEREIVETFVRSTGPGGQNVNKVSTAVQVRFDVMRSPSLPAEVKDRLMILARNRITKDGVLIILAQRFRTQDRNRQDARERLAELIRRALFKPKRRIATKPTQSSKAERLAEKVRQSKIKQLRQPVKDDED